MFNLSLSLDTVPVLRKTSKVSWFSSTETSLPLVHPSELNHYTPVPLTSHLMKTIGGIVLIHLHTLVSSKLDPLQFAYHTGG